MTESPVYENAGYESPVYENVAHENVSQKNHARPGIVAGVDPSDSASRAADWAAREAVDRGVPLHLVHALGFPTALNVEAADRYFRAGRQAAGRLLSRVGGELRERYPDLEITTEVSDLAAPEALVKLSRTAELLVTGTRGHGGFTGLLLGSVSLKIAAHAHCPVVVVRGERPAGPPGEIVLGVEPYQAAAPIEFAFAAAARRRVRLRAVRAWWPTPSYGEYDYDADPAVREREGSIEVTKLLKQAREHHPGVAVTIDIVCGNAVPTLIEAARGARMLVLGAHRRNSPLSVGVGYVIQGVLAHSATPVAVVPVV